MSNNKNKKYYKNNNYNRNNKKNNNNTTKINEVTYDSLLKAKIDTNHNSENEFDKLLIIKYVALTIVLFTIIICSLILFKYV